MKSAEEIVITILIIIAIAVLCIEVIQEARAGDYYYYEDEPVEIYEIYPTRPGTSIRDYNRPGYRIEVDRFGNERGYPLRPGTSIRDYNQPGYHIERR